LKGFSTLVEKIAWVRNEETYLELFLERVKLVDLKNSSVAVPDKEEVLEAFNKYSNSRSDLQNAKGRELPTR